MNNSASQGVPLNSEQQQTATLALHEERHNCAQALSCAFAPSTPLDEDTLFALMEGFGGGMGGRHETCGALSAGVAILSLLASDGRDQRTSKLQTYQYVDELVETFRARFGTTTFEELCAQSTVAGSHRCDQYMAGAAEILTEFINREELRA